MHWLIWAFAARRCKIKIQNHATGNWKVSNLFNEMLPTIFKATSDRGPYSRCISPNIIPSWNTFCDLGSNCLQTLFYKFYKIGTSLNIIESDATSGLGLQCSPSLTNCKPRERQRKCRTPRLNSCYQCQMIWIQISPGFSCLAWVKLLALDKSRISQGEWAWMYIHVSRIIFTLKFLGRRNSGW